ncbi:hypothetical protein SSPS47_26985 [Streptomyces sp. S4.7]|nr:hypothetical protein SSPS47_26985 [Streptomyces sp. S4.7]
MTTGSVLGVVSLLIIAAAPNLPLLIAGWLLAGLAMAATFYQPAFAALADHGMHLARLSAPAWRWRAGVRFDQAHGRRARVDALEGA